MPAIRDTIADPFVSTKPVLIRRFQSGDEASFLRLNEEWIVKYFALEAKDREVLSDPAKYILKPGGEILFATIGEETVGCCALAPTGTDDYEVAKMAVTQEHQARGIGRKLLEAVVAEARAINARRLHLETNSKLESAIHLYESVGFRHIPADQVQASPYARSNVSMEMVLR